MKRVLKIAAAVVGGGLLTLASGIAWYAFSEPPTERAALAQDLIDVRSIEGEALLTTAASKSDYSQLDSYFVPQSRRGFCGVATAAMVMNAAVHSDVVVTQRTLFTPEATAVRSEISISFTGFTLDQLADVLRSRGLQVDVIHAANSSLESFRDTARTALADWSTFVIVNYDRATLQQVGAGHISPLGAYNAETDRLLVLDVAAHRYPYTWVRTAMLWQAMNSIDSAAGQTRGYLLVRAQGVQ